MNTEKQRIAIAEACGWTDVHFSLAATDGFPAERRVVGIPPKHCTHDVAPDYLEDLNAMHEAEKTLTDEQFYDFHQCLKQITLHTKIFVDEHERAVISATATHRAEAFLRTIGKWEADK